MRQISIEGRSAVFKSHTVSKVIHLVLLRNYSLVQLLHNYEKYRNILSDRKKMKIKHENMKQIATKTCNNFEKGKM